MPRTPPFSLADFRARFPEFPNPPATDALVTAVIQEATDRVDPCTWGDLAYQGTMKLSAHLVCISPWGRSMKLTTDKGKTVYGNDYEELQMAVGVGGFVA